MSKPGVIIQARTDSGRFPNKVLKLIEGKSVLWHVITRVKEMNLPIVVATTNRDIDKNICQIAKNCNIDCFQGKVNDVLDRYYQAAKKFKIDPIIRITADCPLVDPEQSKLVLNELQRTGKDLVGLGNTFPDGLDTEGFTFEALESAWIKAKLKSEREHVTTFIRNRKNGFNILSLDCPIDLHKERWTVDYPDDLEFVKKIFAGLYKENIFHMKDIIEFLNNNPTIRKINSHHKRNEGYEKSIQDDGIFE